MNTKSKRFVLLGTEIEPGDNVELNFSLAKLHSRTAVNVPILVNRSKKPGPTVLFTAGVHGDEVSGVAIIRELIASKINRPLIGTVICIPVINIFGFLNKSRNFPDGRDLNRAFPGSNKGSLASRVAHELVTGFLPLVDYVVDFHTGGADRFNAAQIRINPNRPELKPLAQLFGAPFIVHSRLLAKSFRASCQKQGVPMLLFEGGKSNHLDQEIIEHGLSGAKRVLAHLKMIPAKLHPPTPKQSSIIVEKSHWIRAKHSGMFQACIRLGDLVAEGDIIGEITDPFGKFNRKIKSTNSGYIFNINEAPLVYNGDALFHISTKYSHE
jgi:predicted deacylase